MNRVYPAIIHKEKGSYWMEFPDLEGCCSMGESLEECMGNAKEALVGYLAVLLENGDEIPRASSLENISSNGIKQYISY
jgi:predicted RNase H-like HicB family nuclease